jgi:hypothetical protein
MNPWYLWIAGLLVQGVGLYVAFDRRLTRTEARIDFGLARDVEEHGKRLDTLGDKVDEHDRMLASLKRAS